MDAISLATLDEKMVTLKDLNEDIQLNTTDEFDRINFSVLHVYNLTKKIVYLNLTRNEMKKFEPVNSYIMCITLIYDAIIYKPKLFDTLKYDTFTTRAAYRKLSQFE